MADNAFVLDPNATRLLTFNWADLLGTGETISTASIESVTTDAITCGATSNDDTTATATVTLGSAGAVGSDYQVRCRVTTSAGETEDDTVTLLIREK